MAPVSSPLYLRDSLRPQSFSPAAASPLISRRTKEGGGEREGGSPLRPTGQSRRATLTPKGGGEAPCLPACLARRDPLGRGLTPVPASSPPPPVCSVGPSLPTSAAPCPPQCGVEPGFQEEDREGGLSWGPRRRTAEEAEEGPQTGRTGRDRRSEGLQRRRGGAFRRGTPGGTLPEKAPSRTE